MADIALNLKQKPRYLLKFLSRNVGMCRAGQALTQDVPADALALGRSRQVTKKEWAKRLRGLKSPRDKKTSR
jgi:hypothetical protein